jgi:hypothetical protein
MTNEMKKEFIQNVLLTITDTCLVAALFFSDDQRVYQFDSQVVTAAKEINI